MNISWGGYEEQERLFTIKLTRKEKLTLESLVSLEIEILKEINAKTDEIKQELNEEIELHKRILKKLEEAKYRR
ncbi:hypothetical protein [Thermoanaerobacter sp. A7A]|uniref:hypothetical protein n=1 Tax=Thermoanaerobacter sp. A7A TaxID=1350366 RepID=UPI0003FD6235|nr:hypothetical protein [Thermoanaerobacter sp. A7A]